MLTLSFKLRPRFFWVRFDVFSTLRIHRCGMRVIVCACSCTPYLPYGIRASVCACSHTPHTPCGMRAYRLVLNVRGSALPLHPPHIDRVGYEQTYVLTPTLLTRLVRYERTREYACSHTPYPPCGIQASVCAYSHTPHPPCGMRARVCACPRTRHPPCGIRACRLILYIRLFPSYMPPRKMSGVCSFRLTPSSKFHTHLIFARIC